MDATEDNHQPKEMNQHAPSTPSQSPEEPQYHTHFDEAEYKRWTEKVGAPKPK